MPAGDLGQLLAFGGEAPSWEDWADANQIPEDQRNAGRTLVDKEGHRPDIFFLQVPEPKITKNRLHLDIKAAPGLERSERRERIETTAERLIAAGATIAHRFDSDEGFRLVMEGNEFCVT